MSERREILRCVEQALALLGGDRAAELAPVLRPEPVPAIDRLIARIAALQ